MTLYDDVTSRLQEAAITSHVMQSVLEPADGKHAPFAPASYAARERADGPQYAESANAFIASRGDTGWYDAIERESDGRPRRGKRLVVKSAGACAGNAETALNFSQTRMGVTLPAIIIDGDQVTDKVRDTELAKAAKALKTEVTPLQHEQIRQSLAVQLSTWELPHRVADSWLQFACEVGGDGTQLWKADIELAHVIRNISHACGTNTYRYAPNAAIFGNWISGGTARRHAIPRAYTCEIVAYGVNEIRRGATKLDAAGGTVKEVRKLRLNDNQIEFSTAGTEPSEHGFGQVPSAPQTKAFESELILRQASTSLKALDKFSYDIDADQDAVRLAAKRVYVLLAMAGHLLAGEDGFLRSGCDLVTVEERWGWRKHGEPNPIEMPVPTVDEVGAALREAIQAAADLGLEFAPVQTVTFSGPEVGLIIDRVLKESSTKKATE